MKFLAFLLPSVILGLAAAIYMALSGGGFVMAMASYVAVGMGVTFVGVALLVYREIVATSVGQAVNLTALATAISK